MEKVILYEFENATISIVMSLYFNEDNKLIFEGHDVGKTITNLMQSKDYEYFYSIEYREVKKIVTQLNSNINNKKELLLAIKTHFNDNDAYIKFGNFMKENNILFTKFTQ